MRRRVVAMSEIPQCPDEQAGAVEPRVRAPPDEKRLAGWDGPPSTWCPPGQTSPLLPAAALLIRWPEFQLLGDSASASAARSTVGRPLVAEGVPTRQRQAAPRSGGDDDQRPRRHRLHNPLAQPVVEQYDVRVDLGQPPAQYQTFEPASRPGPLVRATGSAGGSADRRRPGKLPSCQQANHPPSRKTCSPQPEADRRVLRRSGEAFRC